MKKVICFVIIIFFGCRLFAQDTLPNFTLVERGEKIIISWTNPFQGLKQVNIQRSYDSLKYYSTIYSTPSPELPRNGFTDTKMPTNRTFYRIFYVLEGGAYFFTPAKRIGAALEPSQANSSIYQIDPAANKLITIKIKDTVYTQLAGIKFRNFRDSVLRQTKDTLEAITDVLVILKPYVAKEYFRQSFYIYANRDGFINISLPNFETKKYSIKFFEDNGASIFEIKHVRESPLILDKANFIHAGWFLFELYEDDKLKEKNKFYLSKDF